MQSALNTIKELYEARITDLWKTIAALKRDKAFLAGAILMLGIFILYLFVDGMHGNWGFFQYPTI